ncbi:MAG: histidine phosphotransferase family protein [Gemmobacter sp.]
MAVTEDADLAALVASRLCHDLISPLGAIGNGVELIALDGQAGGRELALISDAVGQASARVRFLRVAFGMASADQRMGSGEVRQVLGDVTRGGRVAIDWAVQGDRPRVEVRLAFLAAMCLEAAMPRGGQIVVDEAAGHWSLRASGGPMRPAAGPFGAFGSGMTGAGIGPNTVQFALLDCGAAAIGRRVTAEIGETAGSIAF